MKRRITEDSIKTFVGLDATGKDRYLWDTDIIGYFVKVTPAGHVGLGYQYKHDGRTRRYHLGKWGKARLDDIRREAKAIQSRAQLGHDPAGERAKKKAAPTLRELSKMFMANHVEVKLKPGSVRVYRSYLDLHILPKLGSKKVTDIERSDLVRFHQGLAGKKTTANRCMAVLSKMLNYAEDLGFRDRNTNPATRAPKYPENKRGWFLSPDELKRLGKALKAREKTNPSVVLLVRLLLLTGCRLSEIRTLRWERVDIKAGEIHLQDAKSGARDVALSAQARLLLSEEKAIAKTNWVIPGREPDSCLANPSRAWNLIRKEAKLEGLRLHDLRHSVGGMAASSGMSLIMVGAILGHRDKQSTERYAHLYRDPVKTATETVASDVWDKLNGG